MSEFTFPSEQLAAIALAQKNASLLKRDPALLSKKHIELILTQARSHNGWTGKPVSDELLKELFDIVKMGSTSMNTCPARFIFIRTDEAKQRLKNVLMPANIDKVLAAPVTVIIGYDNDFHQHMPRLFPHNPNAANLFINNPENAKATAFRNSSLQGAYLMIAARALGLDIGPMSGFKNEACDEEFFSGTNIKSNFLCSLGYGDTTKLFQRLPRFDFEDVCEII